MKIGIEKEKLVKALQMLHPIITPQAAKPILQNIEFNATGSELKLTSTDTMVTMRCSIEANITGEGKSSFSGRRLFNIIRELPHQNLEIEVNDDNIANITCGSSTYKLFGIPPDEFPDLHQVEETFSHTVDQKVFKDLLKKTCYAASTDDSNEARRILTGVLLSFKDQKMTTVATDSKRLSLFEIDMEIPGDKGLDIVVPSKTVNELIRNLRDEGSVKITASKTAAAFAFDNVIITTKLIEGTYPNYRQVIPSACEQRIVIEREVFLSAVKRVSLIDENVFSIKLTFSDNQLTVQIVSKDIGEAREVIPVKYSGEEIVVAFNPLFLMEPLKILTSDEIYFEVTDSFSPSVIKADIPFLYVIMPLRIT